MRRVALIVLFVFLIPVAGGALAHHPPTPPPAAIPHSIEAGSEASVVFDATEFRPPGQTQSSTVLRLSTAAIIEVQPWLALTGRLPVQMLRTSGEAQSGLGNLAVGALMRRGSRAFELVVSTELRLPTGAATAGAYQRAALVPRVLVAHRGRVSSYTGLAVLVDVGGEKAEPMADGSGRVGDELQGFVGASAGRGRFEGRLEMRASRPLSDSDLGSYVGTLAGAGARLADRSIVQISLEIPVRNADRMRWSASLSLSQRF